MLALSRLSGTHSATQLPGYTKSLTQGNRTAQPTENRGSAREAPLPGVYVANSNLRRRARASLRPVYRNSP